MAEIVQGRFEDAKGLRWYRVGSRNLPSVTTALGWVFHHYGWFGRDVLAPEVLTARRRGIAVHKACEILAHRKQIDGSTLHPSVRPYVEQFAKFLAKTGFRATAAEIQVTSDRYGYGGTTDLVGEFPPYDRESQAILDIKATEDVWLAGYQVAAYLEAYKEQSGDTRFRKRGTIILTPEKYKLRELDEPQDFQIFLSALNCFRVSEANGKL